jgi:outer membrane protein assembly factor BamB
MQIAKNKTTTTTLAIILMLTIAAACTTGLPAVNAAEDIPTHAFIAVSPNPVGVDQTALVVFWLSNVPPFIGGSWVDRWEGYKVTITKPDGNTQTMGPYVSDPVASQYFQYTPDQEGTYTFQFSFPGEYITGLDTRNGHYYNNTWFEPSTSPEASLVVQQEPIPTLPTVGLPSSYWERPIYGENRDWWSISGNWLEQNYNISNSAASGAFNPYTTAPNTGHIIWANPIYSGGLVGGDFGTKEYYGGLVYESKFVNPIVMQGRLYFNLPLSSASAAGGEVCIDIRTGEELWQKNIKITCGQLLDYETPNQHGIIPYLWQTGSTYNVYDPFTGEKLYTLTNAQTGSIVMSPTGEMLVYILNGANNWLAMWNSSRFSDLLLGPNGTEGWQWRPVGKTVNWQEGIQWNVTVPDVPGTQAIVSINSGIIYAKSPITTIPPVVVDVAYSADTGQQMWVANRTYLEDPSTLVSAGVQGPMVDGVYVDFKKETMQLYGFDIFTGQQLWVTEPYTNAWAMYGRAMAVAYGKLYTTTYDGTLHCYDVKTGEHLWDWFTGSAGFETVYGGWPFSYGLTIADGKVYAVTGEHSPNTPLIEGGKMFCIDANTGELIWSISGWYDAQGDKNFPIADGYIVALNYYDGKLYCFGKGQSATTVSLPDTVQSLGTSVLIKGTVTDQSPGNTCLGIPAAGTPAIADDSMTPWMEYLYMQKPMPTNATGVEVSLDTLDPNGNFVHIGTAISDTSGKFSYMWTPEVPGKYTVIATFAGSESYWPSYAETAVGVSEAPATTPPTQTTIQESPMLTYVFAVGIVLIILAVAAIVLLLRRK